MAVYGRKEKRSFNGNRINILIAVVFLFGLILILKCYQLQVLKFDFYTNRAKDQQQSESELIAKRGEIFLAGQLGSQILYPFAANKDFYLVYAIPADIANGEESQKIADALFKIFDQAKANEEIDKYFADKDKEELAYELALVADLPADLKNAKEAEIKRRFNLLRQDKTWLKVREEKKKEELEKKKKISQIDYFTKLNKEGDPYEPLKKKVGDEELKELYSLLTDGSATTSLDIKNSKIWRKSPDGQDLEIRPKGVYHSVEKYRYYPERNIGAHLLGFVRFDSENASGNYGLEGFFNNELAGVAGYLKSELAARRDIYILNGQKYDKPKDGEDLILTIDRSVQFYACQKLKEAIEIEEAESGSLIAVDPSTGAIIAMCSWPDFDPNEYQKANDMSIFNNPVIFEQYEPGSVFKAITMAGALDDGRVAPNTVYNDEGKIKKKGWEKPIKNSDFESKGAHGWVDMVKILELSLNTGAIFLREQLGSKKYIEYVKGFGFGEKTGIELEGESSGDISNLVRKNPREIDLDTTSFGQALTVTPLQMIMSYAALANGGVLMKPFVVKEIVREDGSKEATSPREVRRVISDKAANLTLGMLVKVVDDGHAKKAQISGYFIGGKTGTAQIPDKSGYGNETIHTFIGIAPVDDPKFVMLTKINRPKKSEFAEGSVVPLWRSVADFMIKYYQIPKTR